MDLDINTIPIPQECRDESCTLELVPNDQHGGVNVQHNRTSATLETVEEAEGGGGGVVLWLAAQHAAEFASAPAPAIPGVTVDVEGVPA